MTEQRYAGKTVVVTGAARGIGRGIAERFAGEGAHVVLADLDPAVHEAADHITSGGGSALAVPTDVTDPDRVNALYETAESTFGGVHVSVQNAGVISIHRLADLTERDWDRVMAVNTKGVFLCAQAAAAAMRRHGVRGRILNAASGQSRQGFVYTPHYAASKFGVMGITQSLAKELAPEGITVNAYAPGIVGSDMWDYNDRAWGELLGDYGPGELMKEWVAGIPAGRAGTPDDIANVLLFLASDAAEYVTGQTINIDGGMFMS
ncbi:glucose 1-dehydrogenase [Streptomyces violens]|uniref:glucose 1-dehydrogenase n=1 Tax=Streptomyces violens TaxID=66377 RepID=UPI0004C12943|nr:glucose 1-dehydrogenase [Streptomyces violens]